MELQTMAAAYAADAEHCRQLISELAAEYFDGECDTVQKAKLARKMRILAERAEDAKNIASYLSGSDQSKITGDCRYP